MKCETCAKCKGITRSRESFEIKCAANGVIKLAESYESTFTCNKYREEVPKKEKPKRKIRFVMRSGAAVEIDASEPPTKEEVVCLLRENEFVFAGDSVVIRTSEVAFVDFR